jgi:hypothetical protein
LLAASLFRALPTRQKHRHIEVGDQSRRAFQQDIDAFPAVDLAKNQNHAGFRTDSIGRPCIRGVTQYGWFATINAMRDFGMISGGNQIRINSAETDKCGITKKAAEKDSL